MPNKKFQGLLRVGERLSIIFISSLCLRKGFPPMIGGAAGGAGEGGSSEFKSGP